MSFLRDMLADKETLLHTGCCGCLMGLFLLFDACKRPAQHLLP